MKKFIIIFLLSTSVSYLFSQNRAVAPDFTATDINGNQVHLYDILDEGKYVLIDFFYASCRPCQRAVGKVAESYRAFGCNNYDVFYMEISPYDNHLALETWVETYGINYPTIGTDGSGNSIVGSYSIEGYPTVVLISPDKQIVISDLWPINDAQNIIDALEAEGISQHSCDTATAVKELVNSTDFEIYPNPANEYFVIKGDYIGTVEVYNFTGQLLYKYDITDGNTSISTEDYAQGVYFVKFNNRIEKLIINK